MADRVYTIGHSTHSQEEFVRLLKERQIAVVGDVRSRPYSGFAPQFNRESIQSHLRFSGIQYVYLGEELGARTEDPWCYEGGKVQYDRLAQTAIFRKGIERVRDGVARGFRLALMCAEKEPVECHRAILVARYLEEAGVPIDHIHANGAIESQREALFRLARKLRIPEPDMFRTEEDMIQDTYRLQSSRIAYKAENAG